MSMQVHRHNTSAMAELIRGVYAGDATPPKLNVTQQLPLQLLVGIGIEKLRRDFMTPFIREHRCGPNLHHILCVNFISYFS